MLLKIINSVFSSFILNALEVIHLITSNMQFCNMMMAALIAYDDYRIGGIFGCHLRMYDIGDHVAELLLSIGIHTLYIIVRLKQSPVVHRSWHLVIVKRHHVHILCYPYCLRMIQTTGVQCHQHHINGLTCVYILYGPRKGSRKIK